MRVVIRVGLITVVCLTVAGSAVYLIVRGSGTNGSLSRLARRGVPNANRPASRDESVAATFDVILDKFEDGGYEEAIRFMPAPRDPSSLQELRESVRGRARRGLAELRGRYDALGDPAGETTEKARERIVLEQRIGFLQMYEGRFREAGSWLEKALGHARGDTSLEGARRRLTAVLGIIAMRRGEIDNCLECTGASTCIFPIAAEAVHRKQEGSRDAMRWFGEYLNQWPRDLRVVWLMNIAAMTLGEYPGSIPAEYRLAEMVFRPEDVIGRFTNVAVPAGLTSRGPNLAGGSVFDDFNGDGRPDLFTTSLDADLGASLFLNQGDGRFEDYSASAGLGDQVYVLNLARADYDNDGDLDLLLLRGGWEKPLRMSLLRNRGDGSFDDVTAAAALIEPIASESAAWGDYDNDGRLDLYVCGEFLPPGGKTGSVTGDPRNHSRLYHNQGDGTFRNVAAQAGVENLRCGKGSAWGDYDDDGRLDLFVSNMGQPCRLYHNQGDGTFKDVATEAGTPGAEMSFACWFWDYDNDGLLDLYVNDYRARVAEVLLGALKIKLDGASRPRLYKNLGSGQFREVAGEVGLDRPMAPMGANFGDLDNDGYLDIYLGTGDMSYEGLDVNLLFRNVEGVSFADVTTSAGVGHLQKGHGVSFADFDDDGDLDLFVELGGATPGDQAYNALFRNPGGGRRWLNVKLVGTKTNRSALGARIRADLVSPDGKKRSIFRTIGNNGSFGGNPLVEHLGLLDSDKVALLTITWPTSRQTQTFHEIPADRSIVITEGQPGYQTRPPTPKATTSHHVTR